MPSAVYQVIEHTCSCQHIREYPNGVKSGCEGLLKVAVKQYKPLLPLELPIDAVTVIATHANGFPKVSQIISLSLWRCTVSLTSPLY